MVRSSDKSWGRPMRCPSTWRPIGSPPRKAFTGLVGPQTQSRISMTRALPNRLMRRGLQHLGVIMAVLWGAATITFLAVKLIPGDPVSILTGGENVVDQAERTVLIQQYGLDRPLIVQYARYLGNALSGNFGESYQYRQPVTTVILEAAVPTLQLASGAVVL